MTEMKKTRRKHSAKVRLSDFLSPDGFWPSPYSIEMAFQVMRHLVISGVGYKTRHYWHTTSITSLLGAYSDDYSYPKPITSIDDLRVRFQRALFSKGSPEIEQWRKEKGIHAYAELDMKFLHYKPFAAVSHLGFNCESDIHKALNSLLIGSSGKKTSVSLNCIHQGARTIHHTDITISPAGFKFVLRYGFHSPEKMREKGDSEWDYLLARTQGDEPFLDTLRRALDQYAFVMDPKNSDLALSLGGNDYNVGGGEFIPKSQVPELM